MNSPLSRRFEDIKVDDSASFTVKVTETELTQFARLVGDFNPLHVDEEFARSSQFGQRISPGMLIASYFSTLVGMYLPGRNALYLSQETNFIKPVNIGDTIEILGTVINKSETTRILSLKTQVFNQHRELVVDGVAKVMVLEEFQGKIMEPKDLGVDLSDKKVLVTGASRGIGAASAIFLARNRASVVVNYHHNEEKAKEVLRQIGSFGGRAIGVKADVTNPVEVRAMVDSLGKDFGPINVLVNNAAPSIQPKDFLHLGWEEFQNQIEVILRGAYHCIQAVLEGMLVKKYGKIINILTTYAFGTPPIRLSPYITAKNGLYGLSRALAAELGPMGIRVNMIAPGMTHTSLISHVPPRMRDVYAHQAPLKRIAEPEDIAKAVVFLASDASDFITGAVIPVCGGHLML